MVNFWDAQDIKNVLTRIAVALEQRDSLLAQAAGMTGRSEQLAPARSGDGSKKARIQGFGQTGSHIRGLGEHGGVDREGEMSSDREMRVLLRKLVASTGKLGASIDDWRAESAKEHERLVRELRRVSEVVDEATRQQADRSAGYVTDRGVQGDSLSALVGEKAVR